jgi:hypothetical protein
VLAVGDLHGDLIKTKKALQIARVAEDRSGEGVVWTGGDTVVVQLGDVLDRGDTEIGELAGAASSSSSAALCMVVSTACWRTALRTRPCNRTGDGYLKAVGHTAAATAALV